MEKGILVILTVINVSICSGSSIEKDESLTATPSS